jgi:hypothetical protein
MGGPEEVSLVWVGRNLRMEEVAVWRRATTSFEMRNRFKSMKEEKSRKKNGQVVWKDRRVWRNSRKAWSKADMYSVKEEKAKRKANRALKELHTKE